MPKAHRRDNSPYYDDGFDARAYAQSSYGTKKKNKKKKSHRKRDKERGEKRSLQPKSLVDYDSISSGSDIETMTRDKSYSPARGSGSGNGPSRVSERSFRRESPATALRAYMNDKSKSNSPISYKDSSPMPIRSDTKRSSGSARRHGRYSPDSSAPRGANSDSYNAKAVETPKAYADLPKAYMQGSHSARTPSPPPHRRRRRSSSPHRRHRSPQSR